MSKLRYVEFRFIRPGDPLPEQCEEEIFDVEQVETFRSLFTKDTIGSKKVVEASSLEERISYLNPAMVKWEKENNQLSLEEFAANALVRAREWLEWNAEYGPSPERTRLVKILIKVTEFSPK